MTAPAVQTWQEARADAIEVEADNIEACILGIDRIEGLYKDRPEIRDALSTARDLISMDVINQRKEADSLRDQK